MLKARAVFTLALGVAAAAGVAAQRPTLARGVAAFVKVDAPIVALTHVRVIDGTGAAPRDNQTVVINGDTIAAVGADGSVTVPQGATTIDAAGKTVMPGLVMMHEHLYYPVGSGVYGQFGQ